MRIQHNIPAMGAYRNYTNNVSAMRKNLERLSSGYKINRAGDDAAGLAISEKMRAQITGLETAQKNAKDGISLVQTAEGALTEVHDMLNRMVTLATQSANGTYDNETDRVQLQKELDQLRTEIDRIADSANFNGIMLLDGVSGSGRLSELPVEYNTISATDGITIDSVTNGGGTNGQFTIDINKMFSFGDTLTINGYDAEGNALSATYTYTYDTATTPRFSGDTIADQAESLANSMAADFGAHFDIEATDDGKIIMTAKGEGTEAAKISGISTTNQNVEINDDSASTTGSPGTGTPFEGSLEVIGGADTNGDVSGNISAGDRLVFEFTDGQNRTLTATIIATEEMADANAETATKAIVEALNEAHFKDNADTTGVDESQLKVSDLFTLTENTAADGSTARGTISFEGVNNPAESGGFSVKKLTIDRDGQKTEIEAIETTASAPGTLSKESWKSEKIATNNFTAGDKVKVTGTLADGREFEVTLEAGKDFKVDKNADTDTAIEATVKNLADAFKSKDLTVTLKDATTKEVVGTMTGEDLFGDDGEFIVSDSSGVLQIESQYDGGDADTYTGSVLSKVEVIPLDSVAPSGAVKLTKQLPQAQTSAMSTFTFDEKLGYGAAIRVGDHTYEIVKDARDTTSRNNTAIVVSDPTDSAAVAAAVAKAISDNEPDYTAEVLEGGTVRVSSDKVGSKQVALELSMPYGDKIRTASFRFDPNVVKEGSILNFNDNTYEFVKKGQTPTTKGAIAIEMDDPAKASAKELGDAFANVVKNGTASVAEDGTVTLKGVETEDGTISDPRVTFKNNLTLQIGDTAASYNQLTVELSDMHTIAMGINNISIATQEGAQAAIDTIRDAINYVSDVRGTFGATQNRLDHTINNLSVMQENIQDAESTIRDTDVAAEMMEYTKNNILIQSAQAMLAQANQLPQGVLQLLQ